MAEHEAVRSSERWAHLRFSVVGPLLACPPAAGQLRDQIRGLAQKLWRHPLTDQPVRFAVSTIERWYYQARKGDDPVRVLCRKTRRDRGRQQAVSWQLAEALHRQYEAHPRWSYQLHVDNLATLVRQQPSLGPMPSYSSLRRYMAAQGWLRSSKASTRKGQPQRIAREVRSYEVEYVGGLWHLDFHHGSRKILNPQGEWSRPLLLAVLDDHSRLICHAQWYWSETAHSLVHALQQAFLKRGLPRALLTDNGSPMIAAETVSGLGRLSILQQTTLPYSPYQNGKQEVFWGQVEGRLLAMLEGEEELTLALLNQATLAWIEGEYHRTIHSQTQKTPLERWLDSPSVSRPCPTMDELRLAFTTSVSRIQRQSDGTVSLEGLRFEVPARFRPLRRLALRYASWDLSRVWLVDETTGVVLDRLRPLDRAQNASAIRRPVQIALPIEAPPKAVGIAPRLRELMAEYAATGLPPAYLPTDDEEDL
jgi:transposase InsO family protein